MNAVSDIGNADANRLASRSDAPDPRSRRGYARYVKAGEIELDEEKIDEESEFDGT